MRLLDVRFFGLLWVLLLAKHGTAQSQTARAPRSDASSAAMSPSPPVAPQRPFSATHHGIQLDDPWHWLRDDGYPEVDDPEVLAYLNAENAYFEAQMEPHQALVERVFQEMKGRVQEDESSVPQKDGDWEYWVKFDGGKQYRLHYRRPAGGGAEALILDENALAEGKEYFQLNELSVSPDGG